MGVSFFCEESALEMGSIKDTDLSHTLIHSHWEHLFYVEPFGLVRRNDVVIFKSPNKLIYRYYIETLIDSDSGHRYKGVTKTRR